MNYQVAGKILISTAVVLSAVVSTAVDLLPGDTGHVFNPNWNPHAIFHDTVMFLLLDWMAIVSLWLLWRDSSEPLVGVKVSVLLVIGFWTPFYYVTSIFPMASLSANLAEMESVSFMFAGMRVYFNVLIGTAMILIALSGYWLYRQGRPEQLSAQTQL